MKRLCICNYRDVEISGLSCSFPVNFSNLLKIPCNSQLPSVLQRFPRLSCSFLFVSSAKRENREFWAKFEDSASCKQISPVFSPVLRKATSVAMIVRSHYGCFL